jgi:hypothetical protein
MRPIAAAATVLAALIVVVPCTPDQTFCVGGVGV